MVQNRLQPYRGVLFGWLSGVGAKGMAEVLRREFSQKYTVVEPTATVSATMMNVLYADMIIDQYFRSAVRGDKYRQVL